MARDLASRQNALEQRFREQRRHQANRSAVLLNLLDKTSAVGTKNYASRITTGTDDGQVFSDGVDITTFQNDDDAPIIQNWGLYGDAFDVGNLEEDAAVGDPGDFSNLVVKKGTDGLDRAASKINKDLWTGAGTTGPQVIHGLTAVAGPLDDTGIYAGVDRAATPQWASNNFDNGGVPQPFSIALIEDALDGTYNASGVVPNCIITTTAIWRRYKRLTKQEAIEREIQIGGEQYKLDPGVQALFLDGIPIFKDKDCPAGTVVGLSMSDIGIERLSPSQARAQRQLLAVNLPLIGTPEEQYYANQEPRRVLGAELYRLARTGNYSKFVLETKIVLWTEKCNAHFQVQNITLS
jgi:hypothetical protein